MSKQGLGKTLAIIGAIVMAITISFFKQAEWYDIVRPISIAVFLIGILLIPTYVKPKSND